MKLKKSLTKTFNCSIRAQRIINTYQDKYNAKLTKTNQKGSIMRVKKPTRSKSKKKKKLSESKEHKKYAHVLSKK